MVIEFFDRKFMIDLKYFFEELIKGDFVDVVDLFGLFV